MSKYKKAKNTSLNFNYPQIKWTVAQKIDRNESKMKKLERFGHYYLYRPHFRQDQECY